MTRTEFDHIFRSPLWDPDLKRDRGWRSPSRVRTLRITRLIPTAVARRLAAVAAVRTAISQPEVAAQLRAVSCTELVVRYVHVENILQLVENCVTHSQLRFGSLPKGRLPKRKVMQEARSSVMMVRRELAQRKSHRRRADPDNFVQRILSAARDSCDLAGFSDPADNLGRAIESAGAVVDQCLGEGGAVVKQTLLAFSGAGFDPNPEFRTSTALALAEQIRTARDPGLFPILADALQDAGCPEEPLEPLRLPVQGIEGVVILDWLK